MNDGLFIARVDAEADKDEKRVMTKRDSAKRILIPLLYIYSTIAQYSIILAQGARSAVCWFDHGSAHQF